jgi:hypothetical protein
MRARRRVTSALRLLVLTANVRCWPRAFGASTFMGARGCPHWKRYLEGRDWGAVAQFYHDALLSEVAPARFPVSIGSDLAYWSGQADGEATAEGRGEYWSEERASHASHWRKERATYLAEIVYLGHHFAGLQRAPGQRTVVGTCVPLPKRSVLTELASGAE